MADSRNPNAVKVLAAAKKIVDSNYREGENNDTIMGKWFGLNHQPWCAMYVSYCFNEAGMIDLIKAQGPKGKGDEPRSRLGLTMEHEQDFDRLIAKAKERLGEGRVLRMDMQQLDLQNDSYDIVLNLFAIL